MTVSTFDRRTGLCWLAYDSGGGGLPVVFQHGIVRR